MGRSHVIALVVLSAVAVPAAAGDVPLAGGMLKLRRVPARPPRLALVLAAPHRDLQVDPRASVASLRVAVDGAPGTCQLAVELAPDAWEVAARTDGALPTYRYVANRRRPFEAGLQLLTIDGAGITIVLGSRHWPCAADRMSDRRLTAEVQVGERRFCGRFDLGTIERNGTVLVRHAAAPTSCTPPGARRDVTALSLNVLHGLFCPAGSDRCRMGDRLRLLMQWIVERRCPDLIALQEISDPLLPRLAHELTVLPCPGPYYALHRRGIGLDDSLLLSRHPPTIVDDHALFRGLRRLLFTRIDHPLGPLDVFVTHLASELERPDDSCGSDCPDYCRTPALTVRECQAKQVADIVDRHSATSLPAIVTGDFNAGPTARLYRMLTERGWHDAHIAAGNPECAPESGTGCTAGRTDRVLGGLERPDSRQTERLDYLFVVPRRRSSCTVDSANDADGDGIATRLFADVPNPFAPTCGPAPDPICWPSDHAGVELDLNCR